MSLEDIKNYGKFVEPDSIPAGRNSYNDILETIEEDCTEEQLRRALRSLGFDRFPSKGVNDEGRKRLIDRVYEFAESDARLSKDLSSKLIQHDSAPKGKRGDTYFSIIKKDLTEYGKIFGKILSYPVLGILASTTLHRIAEEKDEDLSGYIWFTGLAINITALFGYPFFAFCGIISPKQAAAIAAVHVGTNALSATYEYLREVRKIIKKD